MCLRLARGHDVGVAARTNQRPEGGRVGEAVSKSKPKKQATHSPNRGSFVKGDPRICHDGAAKSKGKQFQVKLREMLERVVDGSSLNDKFVEYLEDIASAANKQSVDAIKLLWDRAYGKSPQPLTDSDGNAVAPLFVRLDTSREKAS